MGNVVEVLSSEHGTDKDWSLVKGEDGRIGYVSDEFIEPVENCGASYEESNNLRFSDDIPSFETWRQDQLNGKFNEYSLGEEVSLDDGGSVSVSEEFTQSANAASLPEFLEPAQDQSFKISPQVVTPMIP